MMLSMLVHDKSDKQWNRLKHQKIISIFLPFLVNDYYFKLSAFHFEFEFCALNKNTNSGFVLFKIREDKFIVPPEIAKKYKIY